MRVFVAGATGAIGRPLVRQAHRGGPRGHRHHPLRGAARRGCAHAGADARVSWTRSTPRGFRKLCGMLGPRCSCTSSRICRRTSASALRPPRQDRRIARARGHDRPDRRGPPRGPGESPPRASRSCTCRRATCGQGRGRSDALLRGRQGEDRRHGRRTRSTWSARWSGAEGMDGLVLRYGFLYGPGTWFAQGRKMASQYPSAGCRPSWATGRGCSRSSTSRTPPPPPSPPVDRGAPGIYNVTDDEPAEANDWDRGLRRRGGRQAATPGAAVARAHRGGDTTVVTMARRCAAPRTPRPSASSAGSRASASWRGGFAESLR